MSAIRLSKEECITLAAACVSGLITNRGSYTFSYHHGGQRHKVSPGDLEAVARVATVLNTENLASLHYRYPRDSEFAADTPETLTAKVKEIPVFTHYKPLQLIQSCRYYGYQSCEHPGWKESEAKAIMDSLEEAAVSALLAEARETGPGSIRWGVPSSRVA